MELPRAAHIEEEEELSVCVVLCISQGLLVAISDSV